MLFVFGEASSQLFHLYKVGALGLDDVQVNELERFNEFLVNTQHDHRLKQEATLLLMGCSAKAFFTFWNGLVSDEKLWDLYLDFAKRKILFCDSVKSVWTDFMEREQDAFCEMHVLDNPVRDERMPADKFRFSVGLPIESCIDLDAIKADRMRLLSFAGSLEVYPERREMLLAMMKIGLPVQLQSSLDAVRFFTGNPYKNYITFLLESVYTLNFPRATASTGGAFQLKGRYWEAMACGTILVEERNPLNDAVNFPATVVNYRNPDDLRQWLPKKIDLVEMMDAKKLLIEKNRMLYQSRRYFRQFSD
jgi:hypothetical protein